MMALQCASVALISYWVCSPATSSAATFSPLNDVVIDGSLNLSNNGIRQNNENTLVIRNRGLADQVTDYIYDEVQLLNTIEAPVGVSDYCICADLIDNDHDGMVDDEDDDCDGGMLAPEDED